jgi:hypothetical protein
VLETEKIELEMRWLCSAKVSSVWVHRTVRWCTGLSGGASDSVRCARLALANLLLSGVRRRCTTINHRTVRWCTGLSGEPFTGELVALGKPSTAYGYNSPDCPVSQRSTGPTVGRAICAGHVAEPTARRRHRTVQCAPDSVRCANGSLSPMVDFAK